MTMVSLLLISIAFSGIPTTRAQGVIKIGIIGPMEWIQGQGMVEGAQIAADEINDAGGILGNTVEIVSVDDVRGLPDATAATGQAAAEEMMTYNPDFIVGGFRTEAVRSERDVFSTNHKIFFIAGAATDELIDDGPYKDNAYDDVREDYAKYRFTFRVTPINSTMLFKSIAGFEKYTMIAQMMPIYTGYASPLKVAVISEALAWADTMHFFLKWEDWWNLPSVTLPSPPYPPGIVYPGLGMNAYGGVDIVYEARVSATAENFPELAQVAASEARVLIHVISGTEGRAFISQWHDNNVKAVPLGINVLGQEIPTHWDVTSGKCEWEGFLSTCGERTPINAQTIAFYDKTIADPPEGYGHAPIYTSYGTYDAVKGIAETITAYDKWPMTGPDGISGNQDDGDEMVPLFEKTDRISSVGHFKYTDPHPMGSTAYSAYMAAPGQSYLNLNPTMKGTLHDVFSDELGPVWKNGYVRALFTQWQGGRLEVVYPVYSTLTPPTRLPYSKIFMLPRLMFPYPTDIIEVPPTYGKVDIYDALTIAGTFGSVPLDANWMAAADTNDDRIIDIFDALALRNDFGKHIDLPLPYCSEGGRMHY